MPSYYLNKYKGPNGAYEVHKDVCIYLPLKEYRQYLGNFTNCKGALKKARELYAKVTGCYYCSRACLGG